MYNERDGFSLVEVIIAIAILGIIAMSLLSYFSLASNYSSKGKDTQKADMIAQSIVEEINSYQGVDGIETKLENATGSAWTVDSLADNTTKKSKLTKKMSVDGTDYQAKVTLDYNYIPENSDGDETAAKYNDYAMPQLEEVYSKNNVVFSEKDEFQTAISNIVCQNTDVSKTAIENAVKRTMCIDFEKDMTNAEICHVRAYYEYKYDGETYTTVLKDAKIEMDKLEHVYLFYHLLRSDVQHEPVRINASALSNEKASKVKIYFVRQKGSHTPPSGYIIDISGEGNYNLLKYASNNVPMQGITSAPGAVIETKKGNRIAEITVEVYDGNETSFTEKRRIVILQTSKGA